MSEQMRVGFVGLNRGMVGGVLRESMIAEGDFDGSYEPVFLSTSQVGQEGPTINDKTYTLADAYDLTALGGLKVIVTCQGGEYTKKVHDDLRRTGWDGDWIDASSELRMRESSTLVLDPVNRPQIEEARDKGIKDFIGVNCAGGLEAMGLAGLFKHGVVEWANPTTYQAVSGAGARQVLELIKQIKDAGNYLTADDLDLNDPASSLLALDRAAKLLASSDLDTKEFGYPIIGNVLPWIDQAVENGQTREEWKAGAEINKLLGTQTPIPIDGTCARVGSFRSHAQAVTIKLKRDIPLDEIEDMITSAHEWVEFVPNTREHTLERLTPAATSGSLKVAVGRVRKLAMGPEYLNTFVVGDQLLWGAAKPLQRMLAMITGRL